MRRGNLAKGAESGRRIPEWPGKIGLHCGSYGRALFLKRYDCEHSMILFKRFEGSPNPAESS